MLKKLSNSGNFALSLFFLVFLILEPATAEHGKLSSAEMRKIFTSNTMSGRNEQGTSFHVYHDQSGTMEGVARNRHYDSGGWEITDDDRYCRQWNRWRKGEYRCFYFYHLNDNVYRSEAIGDAISSKLKIQEGDPKKLKKN